MSDPTEILARQRAVLDIPLNQHLGIVYDGTVDGKAQLHFFSTPELASFGGQLHGGEIDAHGDHRIAMAFAMAALRADGPITIRNAANIATSFPTFAATATACGLRITP